jgi:heat shock protein HslJ
MKLGRTIIGGIILMLAALLAACAAAAQDLPLVQGTDLPGTGWVLVSQSGHALREGTLKEGTAITLRFGDTSIEGFAGCNTYGGSYSASEDSLRLSDLYWTEMACVEPEGVMAQEQAYLKALNATAGFQIVQDQGGGDRLELYDEAGAQTLAFVASTSAALARAEAPASTPPVLAPGCTLVLNETYKVGEPVRLGFALHNQTDRPLYVLTWYTPLEGMAGEILQITRDGQALPYRGMLAKRGDPTRDEYVTIEPGEVAAAQVDLRTGYDLSAPGAYQVQFTAGLQDVTDDGSLLPRKREEHRPQPVSCNAVAFSVVPAPEPTATPTDVPPTPTPEPPAGFRRYVNGPSGVSLWVPESWTVIEPGPNWPILQSYPQDKYIGGEARQPGDTKCDLAIHPPGSSVADLLAQAASTPGVTVVSEGEIVLQSGGSGVRREVESLGRSLSLYAEIDERAVVLTCFGELAPFDEIAITLGPSR